MGWCLKKGGAGTPLRTMFRYSSSIHLGILTIFKFPFWQRKSPFNGIT